MSNDILAENNVQSLEIQDNLFGSPVTVEKINLINRQVESKHLKRH